MNIEVNYVAVLASAIAALVAGAVWYIIFAKKLLQIRPLSPEESQVLQKQQQLMYGVGFVLTLVMAEVLAHVAGAAQMASHLDPVVNGLVTAAFMYIGFVVPVQANHILFGNYGSMSKKLKLFGINTGGQLVSLLAMGAVLGIMQ